MNEILPGIKNVLLVASGKGGVGKSTVATNLSVAMAREGYKVGLLDADLYGPSVPLIFNMEGTKVVNSGSPGKVEPFEKYGVKVMSLGFIVDKERAVIWRGPMASKVLTQLITETNWGELDFLVVDMPPGTGDISITMAQKLPDSKAIIVITPQQLAVSDGRKAANMFKANGIDICIDGIIENMSWFTPKKHPDEKYYLFGKGGGEKLANELQVPMLAKIPLVGDVCDLTDKGKTIFLSSDHCIYEAYSELVSNIIKKENIIL
ncbi:Mrp/NBP35 family ATP-binding protein [Saccharicrinis sp. FJH62]|uniref:Mrp/NBP35 family ATP-binding protein n=1 Tax=Saccharicrinis sp. FJH62 TaxID=3344657 RepID=UPI0035D3F448